MFEIILALQLQSAALIQHDVSYTKKYIGVCRTVPGYICGPQEEKNPIAKIFTDSNNYDLLYITSVAANFGVISGLYSIDKSGTLSQVYSVVLFSAEILAINSWSELFGGNFQIGVVPIIIQF